MILVPILTAVGGWMTARIQGTTEKPTVALVEIIRELRAEIAILKKDKVELVSNALDERQQKREERKIKNMYIVRAEQLERLLQRHRIPVPEMEGNGTTPDHKKPEAK